MNIVVDDLAFLHPSMLSLATPGTLDSNVTPLPLDYSPTEFDVICERGKDCYEHAGNKFFRACVTKNIENYMNAKSRQVKASIVTDILESVRNQSDHTVGGFVKKDLLSRRWYQVSEKEARDKIGQALRDAIKNVRAHSRAEKDASALSKASRNKAGATKKTQSNNEALHAGGHDVEKSGTVSNNSLKEDARAQDTLSALPTLLERAYINNEAKKSSLLNKLFHQSMTASSANDGRTTSCPQLLPGGKSDLSSFLGSTATSKPLHSGSGLSAALDMLESAASAPCLSSSKRKRNTPPATTGNWMQDIAPINVQVKAAFILPESDSNKRRRQSLLGVLSETAVNNMIEEEKAVPHRRCSGFLESLLGTSPLVVPGSTQHEVSALPRDLSNYLAQGPKPHLADRKNGETMFSSTFPSLWKMGSPPKQQINQYPPVPSFCVQDGTQTRFPSSASNPLGGLGSLDGSFLVDQDTGAATSNNAGNSCGDNRDAISQFLSELEPTPILYPARSPLADHARSA